MVFYANLVMMLLLVIMEVYKTFRRGYIISIQILLTVGTFIYLFLNPLLNENLEMKDEIFNLHISAAILGIFVACRLIPYDLISKRYTNNKPNLVKYSVRKEWLIAGTLLYGLYMAWEIFTVIRQYGSISGVFSANRLDAGLGENYFKGNTLLPITLFLKILYYINIGRYFEEKKYTKFFILFAIPMIHHRFVALTRFDFASMILTLLIFLFDEKRDKITTTFQGTVAFLKRKRVKVILMFPLICLVAVPLLVYMQISNSQRAGLKVDYSKILDFNLMKSVTVDLNYYYFFYDLYTAVKTQMINIEYGASWYYYQMLTFVPRAIWENKPVTAFSPRLTEQIYWELGTGSPVVTFTIFGEGFLQFGILGCFLVPIIFVVTRYKSMQVFKSISGTKIYIILTLFSMFTYLRAELPVIYVILDICYAFIIKLFLSTRNKET